MRAAQIKKDFTEELNIIFASFNKEFFGGTMPVPQFKFAPDKKTIFRFDRELYDCEIGAGFTDYDIPALLERFLHLMVHMFHALNNVVDLTSNEYHNKKFLTKALEIGFHVAKYKSQGWSSTSVDTPKTHHYMPTLAGNSKLRTILSSLPVTADRWNQLNLFFSKKSQKTTKKAFLLKYECGCQKPHNSIRTGRRPNGEHAPDLICRKCGKPLICVE